jgi:hypothetical protein
MARVINPRKQAAENLVSDKQLAFYVEQKAKTAPASPCNRVSRWMHNGAGMTASRPRNCSA